MISRLNTILCLANHARPIHIFSQPCIRVHLGACGNSPYFKSQALLCCFLSMGSREARGEWRVGGSGVITAQKRGSLKTREGLKMSLSKINWFNSQSDGGREREKKKESWPSRGDSPSHQYRHFLRFHMVRYFALRGCIVCGPVIAHILKKNMDIPGGCRVGADHLRSEQTSCLLRSGDASCSLFLTNSWIPDSLAQKLEANLEQAFPKSSTFVPDLYHLTRLGSPAHSAIDLSSPCRRVRRRAIHLFLVSIPFCRGQLQSWVSPLARYWLV